MNILFFLIPKSDVAYIYDDYTVEMALNKMQSHRYSSIPVIDKNGKYVGTITEGDMLWTLKDKLQEGYPDIEHMSVARVARKRDNQPVTANAQMVDLISKAMNQNFVPVTDDNNTFIGIITRKDIIQYCYNHMQ
ncbi:MAG: CBS domain-containing protein [Lachnospiraceae bacterium]|nr:CBS domain-containing protein [Lachnospiraceae bacterium]